MSNYERAQQTVNTVSYLKPVNKDDFSQGIQV